MSDMQPDIDLSALSRQATTPARRRRLHPLWLLPLVIALAFLGVLGSTLRDLFQDARTVSVLRARSAAASAQAGTVVLQAAGWVEPDPFPTQVSALTAGVVQEVLVQESQRVQQGEIVARLVNREQSLDVQQASAALSTARAQLGASEAELAVAEDRFEAALEVQEAVAIAEAEVEAAGHMHQREQARALAVQAQLDVARAELETQRHLREQDAAGPWQVELALARVQELVATLRQSEAEAARVLATVAAAEAHRDKTVRDLELRHPELQELARLRGEVARHKAHVDEETAKLALAQQRLDWCEVRSPTDGVVLQRLAMPGSGVSDRGDGAVCTLYSPQHLRVRVDVPQADIALVAEAQEAQVLSSARPRQPYLARVLRVVQRADIQKVTLEVQVEVLDEDALLRPEMLCQVRFLAPAQDAADSSTSDTATDRRTALFVPARLVQDEQVWVLDASSEHATRRRVVLGSRQGDEVEVREGLNLSDKLIDAGREGLQEGDRVIVQETP